MYCGNSPMMMVDPDGEFWFPLCVFGMFNAIMNAPNIDRFGDFAGYFAVGALGYAIAPIGNASNFLKNVGQGALQGGLLGGLNVGITDGFDNFGKGFRTGALWGAAFGVISSEHFQNWRHGGGWNNNQNVWNNYTLGKEGSALETGREEYTAFISKKFNHKITYDPTITKSQVNLDGSVSMGREAYVSYSDFVTTLDHEYMVHVLKGDYLDPEKFKQNEVFFEMRASGYVLKRQGLYSGLNKSELNMAILRQQNYYNSFSGGHFLPSMAWRTRWWHKIPLRYRGVY